jgi:hypothetical protein
MARITIVAAFGVLCATIALCQLGLVPSRLSTNTAQRYSLPASLAIRKSRRE